MQIYKFVAPGLYKNEREAFRPYLLWTFLLFITGALVVYFVVMPLAMIFFLSMEQTGGQVEIHLQAQGQRVPVADHDADPGLRHHVPAARGADACWRRPASSRAQSLRDFRRYAIVAITAVAGVLSPPDPFSMIAMALPTILLYEAGILRVDWVEKQKAAKAAAEAAAQAAAELSGSACPRGWTDRARPPYSTAQQFGNVIPAKAGTQYTGRCVPCVASTAETRPGFRPPPE